MGKHGINQTYILATDTLPAGYYTIEKYTKEILKIDLSDDQRDKIGKMINKIAKDAKIERKYVKHPLYITLRCYEKIFLDMAFIECLSQLNE